MNTDLALALGQMIKAAREPRPLDPSEPPLPPGSIVLIHGLSGTAYQRHHRDGLYHATTRAKPLTHEELYTINTVEQPLVVYRAPVR